MNYKVVIEGEVSLSLPLDGDPNCYIGVGAIADPLTITENGTYTAESGRAYNPVVANVPDGLEYAWGVRF